MTRPKDEIEHDLKYQLAPGIHTWSDCPCGRSGRRGSSPCWECLLEEYVAAYGPLPKGSELWARCLDKRLEDE